MPDTQKIALHRSREHWGYVEPLVVRQGNEVVGGNQRLDEALTSDLKEVPVIRIRVNDTEAKALNLALNKIHGEWNEELLAPILAELRGLPEIDLTGFQPAEIDKLIREVMPQDEEAPIPEPPIDPISKLSDIWQLGKHRILCGKSPDDIPKLLGGQRPDLLLTDPPYGIDVVSHFEVGISGPVGFGTIVGKGLGIVKANKYAPVIGDDIPFDPVPYLGLAEKTIIFGANNYASKLPDNSHWIVWDKKAEVGADRNFFSDVELAWTNIDRKSSVIYRFLWSGLLRAGTRKIELEKRVHPTQKPVGLFQQIIADYEGNLVLDPFLGSGTTLIACEQLGRTCMGIEIEPRYVDVAVKRWETLTGKKAERIASE
jgi:hypothetical protein